MLSLPNQKNVIFTCVSTGMHDLIYKSTLHHDGGMIPHKQGKVAGINLIICLNILIELLPKICLFMKPLARPYVHTTHFLDAPFASIMRTCGHTLHLTLHQICHHLKGLSCN